MKFFTPFSTVRQANAVLSPLNDIRTMIYEISTPEIITFYSEVNDKNKMKKWEKINAGGKKQVYLNEQRILI